MISRGPSRGWTVLVTGASSGLGRCLALDLAQAGCTLILTGRNTHRLEAVAQEARAAGVEVSSITADLSVEGGVETLIRALSNETIDALVNNAGEGHAGPWHKASGETDRALVRLLVDAPLVLTKTLLPAWRLRGRGAVLNVASTGAFQPGPQTSVYYASKSFLLSWSLALAREERSWLAVTTLCPGALKTGFSKSAGKRDVPGAPGPERTARLAIRAWRKGRGLLIPGFANKLLVLVSRTLPPAWVAAAVEALQLSVRPVIEGSTGRRKW